MSTNQKHSVKPKKRAWKMRSGLKLPDGARAKWRKTGVGLFTLVIDGQGREMRAVSLFNSRNSYLSGPRSVLFDSRPNWEFLYNKPPPPTSPLPVPSPNSPNSYGKQLRSLTELPDGLGLNEFSHKYVSATRTACKLNRDTSHQRFWHGVKQL